MLLETALWESIIIDADLTCEGPYIIAKGRRRWKENKVVTGLRQEKNSKSPRLCRRCIIIKKFNILIISLVDHMLNHL